MWRLTRLEMETNQVPLPDPAGPYDLVLREMAERVAATFWSRCAVDITTSCAIGALDDPSVNARCFRSAESYYALVLHHGLMNILHKHSKLLTAAVNPQSVVYCNRLSPQRLTSELLVSWADELGSIYETTGETKGALVKLDPEASEVASTMFVLAEVFVLGHEIGHFLAGHLEESRLVPDERFPWLEFYAENSSHQDEFEADGYGFEAMRDYFESAVPNPILVGALVSTFATLSLMGAGPASATHPSSTDRIHNLVEGHFSADTARLVRRWIDDGDREAAAEALRTAR